MSLIPDAWRLNVVIVVVWCDVLLLIDGCVCGCIFYCCCKSSLRGVVGAVDDVVDVDDDDGDGVVVVDGLGRL